ncbi:probable enoyl-CoA hydratase 1, peroxisomal isoform X2 [Durio zibethinus]|uniref:Probable enoyl-CoA hydratase 1, peroxisomal isoform X2 n=1 Tax=Durio zibethinus TaxID=66656 RepID=A0A6P6A949_DURZI|nr:probable enoyl-CoA hydratase 1, peroxisomal isoform X2 [Durio zibethinus]
MVKIWDMTTIKNRILKKLPRIIGPNKAREISLTAMPLTAEQAEKLGFVNYVVEESELLKKVRQLAGAIVKNKQDLVIRYKSVINDGFKLDLHHGLALRSRGLISFTKE